MLVLCMYFVYCASEILTTYGIVDFIRPADYPVPWNLVYHFPCVEFTHLAQSRKIRAKEQKIAENMTDVVKNGNIFSGFFSYLQILSKNIDHKEGQSMHH